MSVHALPAVGDRRGKLLACRRALTLLDAFLAAPPPARPLRRQLYSVAIYIAIGVLGVAALRVCDALNVLRPLVIHLTHGAIQ